MAKRAKSTAASPAAPAPKTAAPAPKSAGEPSIAASPEPHPMVEISAIAYGILKTQGPFERIPAGVWKGVRETGATDSVVASLYAPSLTSCQQRCPRCRPSKQRMGTTSRATPQRTPLLFSLPLKTTHVFSAFLGGSRGVSLLWRMRTLSARYSSRVGDPSLLP